MHRLCVKNYPPEQLPQACSMCELITIRKVNSRAASALARGSGRRLLPFSGLAVQRHLIVPDKFIGRY